MNDCKKVTVAMSGGIDSAVAALLIQKAGFDTCGATMRLCDKISDEGIDLNESDIADAKSICDKLKYCV